MPIRRLILALHIAAGLCALAALGQIGGLAPRIGEAAIGAPTQESVDSYRITQLERQITELRAEVGAVRELVGSTKTWLIGNLFGVLGGLVAYIFTARYSIRRGGDRSPDP